MPRQTVKVRVERTRLDQFKKLVAQTGFAEIAPATKTSRSHIVKGTRKRGEKPSDILRRVGTVSFTYDSVESLRKDAWKRGK